MTRNRSKTLATDDGLNAGLLSFPPSDEKPLDLDYVASPSVAGGAGGSPFLAWSRSDLDMKHTYNMHVASIISKYDKGK